MISSLLPASQSFLNGLNLIQQRQARAQTELTSGLRIATVTDDPSQVPLVLSTRSEITHITQVNQNLNTVKAEVDTAEGAVSNAVSLVERVQTLATQGQSGLVTADTRAQIAGEVGSVLQQLVAVANTSVGGRFIFAGDADQSQPYSVDLTQNPPVTSYAGSSSTRQVEHPDGTLFSVSKTAQQLFDSADAGKNIFKVVSDLRAALLGNDQAGIDAALPQLKNSGDYLNQQLAFYGGAQDNVASGQSFGTTLLTQLQTRLSGIQDADATQAIEEFQQANTQQQAALESRAKVPRSSLFDFLA